MEDQLAPASVVAPGHRVRSPILHGRHATLEPLEPLHAVALTPVAQDPDIWRFMPNRMPAGVEGVRSWIQDRLRPDHPAAGHVWLVRDGHGTAAGCSSLYQYDAIHERAEVGWTWYGTQWHGTQLNKACKRLILSWAFEEMGLRRVQMKCDARNRRSFYAMQALGATHEGTLRRHDTMWDGHVRDVEVFSILDTEWPRLRAELDARLEGRV